VPVRPWPTHTDAGPITRYFFHGNTLLKSLLNGQSTHRADTRWSRGCAIALLGVVFAIGLVPAASGDELQDVSKLVSAGKLDEADKRADAFLAKNPKDAQMRFLKGVVLSQRGQRDAAVTMFVGLTQDYPELPEPYNNLAVIYAAQGQYDNARAALETAVRVSPNDATAYENLGDIYAALAARSYRDARRYDPKNTAAGRKLELVRTLLTTSPTAAATSSPPTTAPAVAAAAEPPVDINRSQRNIGLPSPAGGPSVLTGTVAEAPEVVVPSTATNVPQGSRVIGIETPNPSAQSDTSTLVGAKTTVAADPSQPIVDVTAAVDAWASKRSIATSDLKVRVDGDTAIARFRAHEQRTGRPTDTDRALKLHKDGATWTVVDERADS